MSERVQQTVFRRWRFMDTKRMKTILLLLLCAILTCLGLASCTASTGEPSDELAEASTPAESPELTEADTPSPEPETSTRPDLDEELVRQVLSDWDACLRASEDLYGEMLWAFSYIEDFRGERTWKNLQLARAAFYQAEENVSKLELPEKKVSYAEYTKLSDTENSLSFLEPTLSGFAENMGFVLLDCATLRYGLGSEVFWMHTLSPMFQQTALWNQKYACQLRILAAETEYLLLILNNEELTGEIQDAWKKDCPRIASFWTGKNRKELEEVIRNCTNELDGIAEDMVTVQVRAQGAIDLFSEALEIGDTASLAENATEIKGLSVRLPYPSWYDDGTVNATFSWKKENKPSVSPTGQEKLTEAPDRCVLVCPDVTQEEVLTYRDVLEQYGYRWQGTELDEEKDILTVTYTFEGGPLKFSWEDGRVTISMEDGIPVCFVPDWYPGSRAS